MLNTVLESLKYLVKPHLFRFKTLILLQLPVNPLVIVGEIELIISPYSDKDVQTLLIIGSSQANKF